MIHFKKLFEVKCHQAFHERFTSRDIDFIIAPISQSQFQSFGLIFRKTNEGFIILYKSDKERIIRSLKNNIRLVVLLRISDRHFGNYTRLDHRLQHSLYFLSNSTPQSSAVDGSLRFLHTSNVVGENDLVDIILPNTTVADTQVPEALALHRGNEMVFNENVSSTKAFGQILGDDFGRLQMKRGEQSEQSVYYYPALTAGVVGIIELYFGPEAEFSLEEISNTPYHIFFDQRNVFWRYFFVGDDLETVEDVQVTWGKDNVPFTKPEKVELLNGRTASVITSKDALPLKSRYYGDKLFATISNNSSKFPGKRIKLPSPDVKRIKGKIIKDTETYYSEMYVYL